MDKAVAEKWEGMAGLEAVLPQACPQRLVNQIGAPRKTFGLEVELVLG